MFGARVASVSVALVISAAGCGRLDFDDGSAGGACSALFCDGFEDPLLRQWTDHSGDVARETEIVHSGSAALRTTITAQGSGNFTSATIEADLPSAISTGSLYFQAWLYAPADFALLHLNLLDVHGMKGDGVNVLVDQQLLGAFAVPGGQEIDPKMMGIKMPVGSWFCLELRVDIDPTAGLMELELQEPGAQAQSAMKSGIATAPDPTAVGYTGFGVGLGFVGNAGAQAAPGMAYDLYYDDVVLGTSPLRCE